MNYRHAYHAGNFADCVKHAVLLLLLRDLLRKPAPFCVLDTHAGIGRYDLLSTEAEKTGEWREGIGQVLRAHDPALADYAAVIEALGLYPGSPAIAARLLRESDRLIACELHPEDVLPLRALFRNDPRVSVHCRDGYAALHALLPPKGINRGLVLIDPPFERPDDFARCAEAVSLIRSRFRAAIVAIWYPIKHRAPVRAFHDALRDAGIRDVLACELLLRPALDPARLNGCGMLVVNPPFGFEERADVLFKALAAALRNDDRPEITARIERIAEE